MREEDVFFGNPGLKKTKRRRLIITFTLSLSTLVTLAPKMEPLTRSVPITNVAHSGAIQHNHQRQSRSELSHLSHTLAQIEHRIDTPIPKHRVHNFTQQLNAASSVAKWRPSGET